MVKGLGPSGPHLDPASLRAKLASILRLISDCEFVVTNVFTYASPASPIYDVELDTTSAVETILRSFYRFTRRRDPVRRPPELDRVSIHHSVTPGTRVRISLMRVSLFFFFYFINNIACVDIFALGLNLFLF